MESDSSVQRTSTGQPPALDKFAQLQAILAGLPMYALRDENYCSGCCCASRRGGCLCCCHPRVIDNLPWVLPCHERIEVALLEAKTDYPQFKSELERLHVALASHDLTIFVDDYEQRIFTSLRGTDCRTCRDISNDTLVFFGCWLCRTKWAQEEYCHVRSRYLKYRSYGCGHSLGGTVMTELAHFLEDQQGYAFDRVDVFNTGASPLARGYTNLKRTEFNAHRVQGDLVSKFFRTGTVLEHPARPEFCSHSLQHFLPEKVPREINQMAALWYHSCCAGIRDHKATELDCSNIEPEDIEQQGDEKEEPMGRRQGEEDAQEEQGHASLKVLNGCGLGTKQSVNPGSPLVAG